MGMTEINQEKEKTKCGHNHRHSLKKSHGTYVFYLENAPWAKNYKLVGPRCQHEHHR